MATWSAVKVTNTDRSPRALHDRHGRVVHFRPQDSQVVEIDDALARNLQARGGAWKIEATAGGATGGTPDAGRRVAVTNPQNTPAPTASDFETPQQRAKALSEQADALPFPEFRELAKGFLGDKTPRSKEAIVVELEAFAQA